jgi:hypothetical protein
MISTILYSPGVFYAELNTLFFSSSFFNVENTSQKIFEGDEDLEFGVRKFCIFHDLKTEERGE